MSQRERNNILQRSLFPSKQRNLFEKPFSEELKKGKKQPLECLGMTFENDKKRRGYFVEKLPEKLRDPKFRKIEGFPVGSEESILVLSDPPYYTTCPNPFIEDFIKHYDKPYDQATDNYRKEPLATDVSEGKNDSICNAHSYHAKVPRKGIMRYIFHYTAPGDVVFDGFCGTSMTGVATQLCDDPNTIASLDYEVIFDGIVLNENKEVISRCGTRIPILNDLSPAATLIAAGSNLTSNTKSSAWFAQKLIDKFDSEYGWMYETQDTKTGDSCLVDFILWSEVFLCPHCSGELEFWKFAYDESSGKVEDQPTCSHCSAEVSKRDLIRRTTTYYDKATQTTRTRRVLRPVEIHYQHPDTRKSKIPDKHDHAILEKAEKLIKTIEYPTEIIMFILEGEECGDQYRGYHKGISRVHDFHLSRQLMAVSLLWGMGNELATEKMKRLWRFTLQGALMSFTRWNRLRKKDYSQVNTNLSGTIYIGSSVSEPSPTYILSGKIEKFCKAMPKSAGPAIIVTQSLFFIFIPYNSIEYIFIIPPFGDTPSYAELNFLWEAWLRLFTNSGQDVIMSGKQQKDLAVYTKMMTACLKEVYRILKPGRWVTIGFHNSKNAVWTAIQESLGRAGFIIADVSVLNKGMKTKKQLHAKAVNKDLDISTY